MKSSILFPAVLLLFSMTMGCGAGAPEADAQGNSPAPAAPSVTAEAQVTLLMGRLADYTDKVGWSTHAKNQPSAVFYLDKVDEVMAELGTVDRWEGMPIGGMAQATMSSSLRALRGSLEKGDWATAAQTYNGMTLSCNSCHAATRRAFVVIRPVTGDGPSGQDFSAP